MVRPKLPKNKQKAKISISVSNKMLRWVTARSKEGKLWENNSQAFRVAMRDYMLAQGADPGEDD